MALVFTGAHGIAETICGPFNETLAYVQDHGHTLYNLYVATDVRDEIERGPGTYSIGERVQRAVGFKIDHVYWLRTGEVVARVRPMPSPSDWPPMPLLDESQRNTYEYRTPMPMPNVSVSASVARVFVDDAEPIRLTPGNTYTYDSLPRPDPPWPEPRSPGDVECGEADLPDPDAN